MSSRAPLLTRLLTTLVAVAPLALVAGCAGDEPTLALLVADGTDASSRAVDVAAFTDRVEATCDECRVQVYDAEGDAGTQQDQARQAEADGAGVVVVVPLPDSDLGALTGGDLPVVSLGTLAEGSDRFVGLPDGEVPSQPGTDLEAAREVVLGEADAMTYVPTRAMSEQAADVAVGLLAETPVEGGEDVDGVQTWLFEDQQLSVDTLASVLVGPGVVTLEELCSGETEERCTRLGLR